MVRRLMDVGIVQGSEITVVSRTESGSVIVALQGCRIGLGAGMAHRVSVTTAPYTVFAKEAVVGTLDSLYTQLGKDEAIAAGVDVEEADFDFFGGGELIAVVDFLAAQPRHTTPYAADGVTVTAATATKPPPYFKVAERARWSLGGKVGKWLFFELKGKTRFQEV